MVDEMRDPHQRRSAAACPIGDARAIAAGAKTDLLRWRQHGVPHGMRGIELPYPRLDRRGPLANAAGPEVSQECTNRWPDAAARGFEVFTEETSTSDKLPARLHSAAFVRGQCVVDVSFSELIDQRGGVLCGFGDTGADMRASHE